MYKIALVCDWYLPRIGGIEHQLRDLQRQLAMRGHDAHIITATPGPVEDGWPEVHRLPVSRVPRWHTVWNWRALRILQRLLIRERFDVVHGHSLYSPLAVASTCVARTLGIPSVLTNHSLLGRAIPAVLFPLAAVAKPRQAADVITGVSRAVVGDTAKSLGRADVFLIPNAVNLADWDGCRQTRSAASSDPRIVSVMRLTRRKRPLDLIRAIPRICSRLPPRLWPRFTIVGDGSERPRAEHEARRLGIADRVDFLGFRPREDLKAILSRSSIFVLPTVKEAFGMAVLEARCVGLPVVAMNHGGIGDILESGEGGYLTSTFDEFADRIADLVRDPSLRNRMAGTGAATLQRFGWDIVTEQYLDVYRRAMATNRGRVGGAGCADR